MPATSAHGCGQRDPENVLWCKEQRAAPYADRYAKLNERLDKSKAWLGGYLQNMDFLFMGFWTDWDYLNEVLGTTVSEAKPPWIFVVDPATPEDLENKARLVRFS